MRRFHSHDAGPARQADYRPHAEERRRAHLAEGSHNDHQPFEAVRQAFAAMFTPLRTSGGSFA